MTGPWHEPPLEVDAFFDIDLDEHDLDFAVDTCMDGDGLSDVVDHFLPSDRFEGAKDGMVFKLGANGVGYDRDATCGAAAASPIGNTVDGGPRQVLSLDTLVAPPAAAPIASDDDDENVILGLASPLVAAADGGSRTAARRPRRSARRRRAVHGD